MRSNLAVLIHLYVSITQHGHGPLIAGRIMWKKSGFSLFIVFSNTLDTSRYDIDIAGPVIYMYKPLQYLRDNICGGKHWQVVRLVMHLPVALYCPTPCCLTSVLRPLCYVLFYGARSLFSWLCSAGWFLLVLLEHLYIIIVRKVFNNRCPL